MVVNKIFRDVKQNNVGKVTDGERDTERRGEEPDASRDPQHRPRARPLSGEDSAEPRQTGRFGRGSCSPRGRPKDQRGELEVYAPLLPPAGPGRRHRGAPGPRRTPPLPTSAGGPGVPASSARQPVGAPSTPARSQPFQPPAVRRSVPLAQLPGGRGETVSCARGVCFRARSAPSPTAARASRPRWRRRPAGPLWTPAPGASFALPLSLFEVVLVIPRLRTSTRFRISVLSSTFEKPREPSQGSGVTHRSVSGDAASWRWGPPAAGAAGSPFFGCSPVRAGRFGFSGRTSSTVLARHRVC